MDNYETHLNKPVPALKRIIGAEVNDIFLRLGNNISYPSNEELGAVIMRIVKDKIEIFGDINPE